MSGRDELARLVEAMLNPILEAQLNPILEAQLTEALGAERHEGRKSGRGTTMKRVRARLTRALGR